ncbi:MAG: ribosome recycling factor [Candidatus Bipolaricaulota bacterium]|nr:ribosome recycling factor [Candidatus Bipolaricaulota bacterium]
MEHELLKQARGHMARTLDVLQGELAKIHTGRANPALVEGVAVDYYGTPTPLRHIAHVVAPDPDLILIRPFDRSQLPAIEKAILAAGLGLNPQNDGQVVRIKVPRLSEERRNELVKLVGKRAEEAKIALRNVRREVREKLEAEKKEGRMSEDEHHRLQKALDDLTAEHTKRVDELAEKKAQEMRTL